MTAKKTPTAQRGQDKTRAKTDGKSPRSPKKSAGATARIRTVVERTDVGTKRMKLRKRVRKIQEEMRSKDLTELTEAALTRYMESDELKPYQADLLKLQQHLETRGRKMIILFDGRDASGKGGTIRSVSRYMNEKHYQVVALGKPTDNQKTELHMKRYIEQFPHAGEVVLFDRSWYNRAMVEPIMGFCTEAQYREFMKAVVGYEESFLGDGKTYLIKLYFSVSKKEQNRRFERRRNDPLRQWKLSEVDLQAQEQWDEFTDKKFRLLKRTHTEHTPWWVIRSDDKHLARMEAMKTILRAVPYRGRSRKLDFDPDPEITLTGEQEIKVMEAQRRKYGKFLS